MKIVALISLILVAINGMRVERMRHTPDHHARVDHGGARVGMHHTAKIQRGDSRMRQRHVPRLIKDNEGGKSIIESDNVNGVPTITFCNTTSTPLIVDSYTISPDDIEPDETVNITLHTTLTEKVTSGTIKLLVKVDKFPVLNTDYDLCTEIQQAGLSCPLSPDNYDITESIDIPSIPISGSVDATATLYDQSNKELACVEMTCSV